MIAKYAHNLFLVLFIVTVNASFCTDTKKNLNLSDKEIKELIEYSSKYLKKLDGTQIDENDVESVIQALEIIKNYGKKYESQKETWRDYWYEFLSGTKLGVKICSFGMALFIPCYLIKKYFGHKF